MFLSFADQQLLADLMVILAGLCVLVMVFTPSHKRKDNRQFMRRREDRNHSLLP